METYIDGNMLARTIASEKTREHREPIVLAYPGIMLRSVANLVRSAIEGIREAYDILGDALPGQAQAATYCTLNPAEC